MHDRPRTPGQDHDAFARHAGWVYGVVVARCDSCVQAFLSELSRHGAGDGPAARRQGEPTVLSYAVSPAGPAHGTEEVVFFQAWLVAGAADGQALGPDGRESCSMALAAEEQARV